MIVDSADNGDLEFSLDELVNSPEGKGDASKARNQPPKSAVYEETEE